MGGVETMLDRPRVLFGDSNHTVLQGALWADTEEVTDRTEFMQIKNDRFIFRRAATRDAFAPFETLAEADSFLDYYVIEGQGGTGAFAYFPDFRRLAFQNVRNEGTGVLPVNMIGAGPSIPLMVANPIILSQSHLGKLGDVWVPIAPGKYVYDISVDLSVPFDLQATEKYDAMAKRLSTPVEVFLMPEVQGAIISTATSTAPAPSTSTPVPSPTATPTPAPKSCAPSDRALSTEALISGSYLEILVQNVVSSQDDQLVVDNSNGQNYIGGKTRFYAIQAPFSVSFKLNTRLAHFFISGHDTNPNPSWWGDGISNIYFSDNGGMSFWDGRGENISEWLPIGEQGEQVSYTIRFLEFCGKQFDLFDGNGDLVGHYDVTELEQTEYPNGLFPDGVVSFGIQIDPGGWLSMSDLNVVVE